MRVVLVFAVLIALAAIAPAADKPNFSGEWKADLEKSAFGPMPVPESYIRKVEHSDPNVSVTDSQKGAMGDISVTLKYTTDGKEGTNDFRGMPAKSSASWDGAKLTLVTKIEAGGAEIKLTETWTLAEDGKTLTSALKFVSPQGEADLSLVLRKQ